MEIIEDLKSQISFFGFEMTDADSLVALEKAEQTFVLYWAKNGFVLFETSKEGVKCILAAHDQRTDSGIKTFRNKTGTGRL